SIAMIGLQEAQILVKPLHCERLHRPIRIELSLFLPNPPGNPRIHTRLTGHGSRLLALNFSTGKLLCSFIITSRNYAGNKEGLLLELDPFRLAQALAESPAS